VDAGRTPDGTAAPSVGRLYLTVPFDQNSEVKNLGARFDRAKRAWWVDGNQASREQVARWLPGD